ncbi:DUF4177 domain-containing protein [Jannaschia marina]|uniref:DUF4177 domain-containing protein n=1 Tax=Jannaschia marina TaxID=2741674 RepID=UPI0015CE8384|nr:DUF4177 domain-containing protein [Jannaschia marina]
MSQMPQITDVLYEYDVVPAPTKPMRVPGITKENERVAYELGELFNDMAVEGWEYVRADRIPIDNVTGISGNLPTTHTMLVFRRPLALPPAQGQPLVLDKRIA